MKDGEWYGLDCPQLRSSTAPRHSRGKIAAAGRRGIANMMSCKETLQLTRSPAREPDELEVDAE